MRPSVTRSPESVSALWISSTVAPGAYERSSAHAPVTWGAAIEVPPQVAYSPPGTEEVIVCPGAKNVSKAPTLEK